MGSLVVNVSREFVRVCCCQFINWVYSEKLGVCVMNRKIHAFISFTESQK